MKNKNDITNELREVAPVLAGLERKNPFKMPEGYLENNQEALLKACVEGEDHVIGAIDNATQTFSIPTGYFDSLSARVLESVKSETGADESFDILAGLKEAKDFVVPAHYFEELPTLVLEKAKSENEGKVIPLERPSKTKVVPMYRRVASIAAIVLLFLTGAFVINNFLIGEDVSFQQHLAELSDQDLNTMIASNIDDIDESMLLDYVDEYDIFDFIEINPELLDEYLLEELDESLLN